MMNRYYQLRSVLEESILAVDKYIESLNNHINMLEKKSKLDDCKKEMQILKLQNQSLIATLSLIKNISFKKLNLVKRSLEDYIDNTFTNKYINLKFEIDNKNKKIIFLRISLNNYNDIGNYHKFINTKIDLEDCYNKESFKKVINIRIYLKDLIIKGGIR